MSRSMKPLSSSYVRKNYMSWGAGDLERAILSADKLYWNAKETGISDSLFDELLVRLEELQPSSLVLQNVGLRSEAWGDPVPHDPPMLSLEKCSTLDKLQAWVDKHPDQSFFLSPKVDGVAISLEYGEDGNLLRASTRGSGHTGEDVTIPVRRLDAVPSKVPEGMGPLETRGELYFDMLHFDEYADTYTHPRNAVAGYLKNRKSEILPIGFFPYWSSTWEPGLGGMPTPCSVTTRDPVRVVRQWMEDEATLRDRWPFEADGIVIRLSSQGAYLDAGATAHHPRGAVAFKFPDQAQETELVDVEWDVSRTGVITPVAVVKPVVVGGATVTRATLHNLGRFDGLRLRVGDTVSIKRRGGVIPHLEAVTRQSKGRPVRTPEHCPACGELAGQRCDGDGIFLVCKGSNCSAVNTRRLVHFAQTIGMKGFGPKVVDQLYQDGSLKQLQNFFSPIGAFWEKVVGDKTAANLIQEASAHRKIPLATFLAALGIPSLGDQTSRILAKKYRTIDKVWHANDMELIPGIGEQTALNIKKGFKDMREEVLGLLKHVETIPEKKVKKGWKGKRGRLHGVVVCFTGSGHRTKGELASLSVAAGASVVSSVTKKTTLLVELGDGENSSKSLRALELRVQGHTIAIVEEEEFLQMVGAV